MHQGAAQFLQQKFLGQEKFEAAGHVSFLTEISVSTGHRPHSMRIALGCLDDPDDPGDESLIVKYWHHHRCTTESVGSAQIRWDSYNEHGKTLYSDDGHQPRQHKADQSDGVFKSLEIYLEHHSHLSLLIGGICGLLDSLAFTVKF